MYIYGQGWSAKHIFLQIVTFMMGFVSYAYGINDDIVEVKSVSSSGRTISLNRGKLDDLRNGEFAVLIVKTDLDAEKSIFKPVAKLKLVKSFESDSVWVAYKILLKNALVKGQKYILLTESQMLKGRSDFTVKRTSLVTNKDADVELKEFLIEGDSLSQKKDDYVVIEKPHRKEKHFETDIDLIDVQQFEQKLGDDKLYIKGIYRSPYAKDFSKRKKVRTFEKMVVAYLNKYNDPTFSYKKFYEEQARDVSGDGSDKSVYGNFKQRYDAKLVDERRRKEKLYESLLSKGEAWSEEYTDNQLKELLKDFSIVRERRRRATLASFTFKHQLSFSFGYNLIDNDNVNDTETTEENPYGFEVSYESEFTSELESLQQFTYEFSFRRMSDSFYGGTYNVESLEYSLASHLNWYPFYKLGTINRNVFFLGLSARFGYSSLSNNTSGDTSAYQLFALPGVNVGIKYSFENSWGYKIALSYQNISVSKVVTAEDGDVLPNEADYVEGKINLGLTRFF